jgi:2-polyprenyl-6-methoxyphenol hydroxylase-like FAD-dependent oxidoreductase
MNILISGAGIAGPTLAFWLHRFGFTPTLVEQHPHPRRGGYVVDFWGAGFDIAERMGLIPELEARAYHVREVRMVNRGGRRVSGFSPEAFQGFTNGRFFSIPRGDLAGAIYDKISTQVEVVFGDSIAALQAHEGGVDVTFDRGAPRTFDLVIGADGLHSRVRELAFGREASFEKYLGYKVAVFEASGYRPRDELVYLMYTGIGQQVSRFSMREDKTMFLFIYADSNPGPAPGDIEAAKAELRARFAGSGWECRAILAAMQTSESFYFDRVSQIRMDAWTRGRIGLVGDAAACVSLLGGQGSALAMLEAYVLAGELERASGDHALAFSRYEGQLAAFVAKKQKAAERFAGFFAPRSRLARFVHDQVTKLLSIPFVAARAVGRDMGDQIAIPDYRGSVVRPSGA